MDLDKKKKLESNGWKVGSADEFLELNKAESEFVEFKLALGRGLASLRKRKKMTQAQLAKMIESSQSRVAKMEKGDPSVSIDLLVRSHFALGATKKSLAKLFA